MTDNRIPCDGSGSVVERGELVECAGCRLCDARPGAGEPRFVAYDPARGWLYTDGWWQRNGRRLREVTFDESVEFGLDAARAGRRAA